MNNHPKLAILWIVTCLILLYPILRAWRRPWEMLGLPFVCGLFGLYFYGYMAFQAAKSLDNEIPLWCREIGHIVVILSALSLFAGWYNVTARVVSNGTSNFTSVMVYQSRLWVAGQILAWTAAAGKVLWDRSGLGYETSAYIYMLPRLVYPGTALGVVAIYNNSSNRKMWRWFLALTPLAICILPELFGARRGPLMALVLTLVVSVAFGRQSVPSRTLIMGSIGAVGLLILAFLPIRTYLSEGSSFSSALQNITAEEVIVRRTNQVSDNEYVYHCGMVGTAYETGLYQYGTKFLTLILHWVPRSYWAEKPVLGEGLYPSVKELMPTVADIEMGPGMSAAGFAHGFEDFGFYVVLFWWLLGWATAKIYVRALTFTSPTWCIAWINVYSCTHWLFAQDFSAFFVPMLFAQAGTFAILKLLEVSASDSSDPERLNRQKYRIKRP